MSDDALLSMALSAAVPLWIAEIRQRHTAADWPVLQDRARECGDVVASRGDNVLYASKKNGESAAAFNRLAEGVAIGAFVPGGITVFGQHFEAHLENDEVTSTDMTP